MSETSGPVARPPADAAMFCFANARASSGPAVACFDAGRTAPAATVAARRIRVAIPCLTRVASLASRIDRRSSWPSSRRRACTNACASRQAAPECFLALPRCLPGPPGHVPLALNFAAQSVDLGAKPLEFGAVLGVGRLRCAPRSVVLVRGVSIDGQPPVGTISGARRPARPANRLQRIADRAHTAGSPASSVCELARSPYNLQQHAYLRLPVVTFVGRGEDSRSPWRRPCSRRLEDLSDRRGNRVRRGRVAQHAGIGRGDHRGDPGQVGRDDWHTCRERLEQLLGRRVSMVQARRLDRDDEDVGAGRPDQEVVGRHGRQRYTRPANGGSRACRSRWSRLLP